MPQQYSPRTFARKVPNAQLQPYFPPTATIPIDIDWDETRGEQPNPFVASFSDTF